MSSNYVGPVLEQFEISASSPCRVDPSGGTWDLEALVLPSGCVSTSTVTIALDLRLTVTLHPYKQGWVKISEAGQHEEFPFERMDFTSEFGLIYACVGSFGFDGLEVEISAAFPSFSGLGGSGVLAVCTLSALNEVLPSEARRPLGVNEIISFAHAIEGGMRFSYAGLQDQASAAYGGVNQWLWNYRPGSERVKKKTLLAAAQYPELESRLVLAYLGKGHRSVDVNNAQIRSFLQGELRDRWMCIREITHRFARALSQEDWTTASILLQEEHEIRCSIVEHRNTEFGRRLEAAAKELGCGFALAGAGGGGCVYALCGAKKKAWSLRQSWLNIMGEAGMGDLLQCPIASEGTKVRRKEHSRPGVSHNV